MTLGMTSRARAGEEEMKKCGLFRAKQRRENKERERRLHTLKKKKSNMSSFHNKQRDRRDNSAEVT